MVVHITEAQKFSLVFCNWSKIVVISRLTFVGDYGLKRGLNEAHFF